MTHNQDRREAVQALLAGVMPGETRVSYPDGTSQIFDNFQLLEDDLVRLIDTECLAVLDLALEQKHVYNAKSTDGVMNEPDTGVLAVPVAAIESLRASIAGQESRL